MSQKNQQANATLGKNIPNIKRVVQNQKKKMRKRIQTDNLQKRKCKRQTYIKIYLNQESGKNKFE